LGCGNRGPWRFAWMVHSTAHLHISTSESQDEHLKISDRVSRANNDLPFVCFAGSKAVLIDCNRRRLRFCFLDQSRDLRFCLSYLGSISSQMDSTTWKAGCISRLSKQLVREAKLTKTYAQRCYYLDPSFTRTAASVYNRTTVSIGRLVGPNQAPKPNTCFGF